MKETSGSRGRATPHTFSRERVGGSPFRSSEQLVYNYIGKDKVTRLPLKGEAQSSLITFGAGDNVKTQEEFSSWSTRNSIAQSAENVNRHPSD